MVYMYHSFLVHSSADGHLGCFHVLSPWLWILLPKTSAPGSCPLRGWQAIVFVIQWFISVNLLCAVAYEHCKGKSNWFLNLWEFIGKTERQDSKLKLLMFFVMKKLPENHLVSPQLTQVLFLRSAWHFSSDLYPVPDADTYIAWCLETSTFIVIVHQV